MGGENYAPWTNEPGATADASDVMHSGYFPGGIRRELTQDEIGGLAFLTGLLPGDASLDGAVDVIDLMAWNNNKMQLGTDWKTGDFNLDGCTDVLDLIIWNNNKFTTLGGPSAAPMTELSSIPEPGTALLMAVMGLLVGIRRRKS